uniref:Serpentine receptor class gamma n=1 Tax=Globodera rostochiensis TaxID=31243 RepID=A0A914IC14_GLORO
MWTLFLSILLSITFCKTTFGSSHEVSQEAAMAIHSNEIKPINGRKVLQPPPPPYTEDDIRKVENEVKYETDDRNSNDWHYGIERRMDMPMSEASEVYYDPIFGQSVVNEKNMRRALKNERRKNRNKIGMVDKKHHKLALHSMEKHRQISQYAQDVDGKVDTLHADHVATRKLAQATHGRLGNVKSALDKHKAIADERLKRYSGELKEKDGRLKTIEEAVNGQQQQADENMETIVKQLGKQAMHASQVRDKIGGVLELHGKHIDKTSNTVQKMKTRTKHLYTSMEVQGGEVDKLNTNIGTVVEDVKALKQVTAAHTAALENVALHDNEMFGKMIESQQMLTKHMLESNKQVLEVLADFAHQLDNKVLNALDNANARLAQAASIGDHQMSKLNVNLNVSRNPIDNVPSLAAQVQHPLFLKKHDPRREQYENEQREANVNNNKTNEHGMDKPYTEELKSSTDESNITYEDAPPKKKRRAQQIDFDHERIVSKDETEVMESHRKVFRTTFYHLFCIRGIFDILLLANSFYGNRLPTMFGRALLPIYRELPNWALASYYFMTSFAYQITNIATMYMLLNRLTAIVLPVTPILDCCSLFQMDATLDVKNGSNFLISEMEPLKSLTSITFMIVCFLINIVTFIAYKRFKQTLGSVQNFDKTEQKLLVYTVITFAGHAILALYLLCVTVWANNPKYVAIVYILYPCVNDIFNLGLSSWPLLWASSTFRGHFINEFYLLKSFKNVEERNTFKTPVFKIEQSPNNA